MTKNFFLESSKWRKMLIIPSVVVTLAMGLAYAVGQQVLRMSANDPQVEISEGVAEALSQGQDPKAFSSVTASDMSKSLSPFVVVYDESGKPLAGTSLLDGQTPAPPKGIFDAAKTKGLNLLTWQPKPGVRIAAVVRPYSSAQAKGFALAGRSLREVEARAQNLLKLTGLAWALSLLIILGLVRVVFGQKERDEDVAVHESPLK